MTFRTLPTSSGKSAAAQRMREAGEAYERAHPQPKEAKHTHDPRPIQVRPLPAPIKPLPKKAPPNTRPVAAIAMPPRLIRAPIEGPMPKIAVADPTALLIEDVYQRDISAKSIRLITRIVANWSWARFKPPIVVEQDEGFFVIDGQHTAIAAATHPDIRQIPILIVDAENVARRADAFVAHNRDRLIMSPFQVFHAELAAHDKEVVGLAKAIAAAGATIPRSAAAKGYAKVGQIVSVGEVRHIYRKHGTDFLIRLLMIAVRSKVAPIQVTLIRALRMILSEKLFADAAARSDADIATAIQSIKNIELESVKLAAKSDLGRHRACAVLICRALGLKGVAA